MKPTNAVTYSTSVSAFSSNSYLYIVKHADSTTLQDQEKLFCNIEAKEKLMGEGGGCRPLGFLIGLPFALVALVLSLVGAIIWILGTVLSCLCPCCVCCAGLANLAVDLVKLPIKVLRWFIEQIPC